MLLWSLFLASGDGLADTVGRRWGGAVLPHNKTKVCIGRLMWSICCAPALLLLC